MKRSYKTTVQRTAVLACLIVACGDDEGDESLVDTSSATGASSTGSDAGQTTTGNQSTGASGSTSQSGDSADSSSGGLAPDGGPCIDSAECVDECYYLEAIGGTCGECSSDADCEAGGCTPPGFLDASPPSCNEGGLSDACESDDACQDGLQCGVALDLGQFAVRGCGTCVDPGDCADGEVCNLALTLSEVRGHLECVPQSSVVVGATCTDDTACESGICVDVNLMTAVAGVCSECREDSDCEGGGTCQTASVDMATLSLIPGQCV